MPKHESFGIFPHSAETSNRSNCVFFILFSKQRSRACWCSSITCRPKISASNSSIYSSDVHIVSSRTAGWTSSYYNSRFWHGQERRPINGSSVKAPCPGRVVGNIIREDERSSDVGVRSVIVGTDTFFPLQGKECSILVGEDIMRVVGIKK